MSIVNVRHISKNTVRVEPERGYNVVVFLGKSPEITVASDASDETVRIQLVPPTSRQTISLRACEDRVVEIVYKDKVDEADGY